MVVVGKESTGHSRARLQQVEGEAQGDDAALAVFLKDVDKGPRSAKVVRFDQEEREVVEDETEFQVRR